jgi:hypothetical protein
MNRALALAILLIAALTATGAQAAPAAPSCAELNGGSIEAQEECAYGRAIEECQSKHEYSEVGQRQQCEDEVQSRAEQAKYEREHPTCHSSPPATELRVTPVAHHGHSIHDPGYTSLDVTTTPCTSIQIKMTWGRHGHLATTVAWGTHGTATAVVDHWECRHPGLVFSYIVAAQGMSLVQHGRFRLSAAHGAA